MGKRDAKATMMKEREEEYMERRADHRWIELKGNYDFGKGVSVCYICASDLEV